VVTSPWRRPKYGPGPCGSKGMSEGALLCVAPAVGAAVRDAGGLAIHDLPLTPERVWRALYEDRPPERAVRPLASGRQTSDRFSNTR